MRIAFIVLPLWLACASSHSSASAPAAAETQLQLDDATLMQRLRATVKSDPAQATALAEEGERRFPDSPFAEERGALAIDALINQQRIGAARGRAEDFLARYPNGPYSVRVATMTGVHPRPSGPNK